MNISISTTQLQALVAKSIKGASCNKMIPMTSMMAIERKHNVVTLVTTDANNYLMVSALNSGEDFYAVVPAVLFSQLIARLTSETTTLVFENNQFVVEANGSYKIELPLDENGEFVKLPAPYTEMFEQPVATKITPAVVKKILKVNRPALATTLEVPCYAGYYVSNRVISTDTYKLCGNDVSVTDTPILVAPETMLLLDNMEDEQIEVRIKENEVLFSSSTCSVYGNLMYGIEDYAVDAISELLDENFDSYAIIPKNILIAAVERVGLFVGQYDNHSVNISFMEDCMEISSPQSSGQEVVSYEKHSGETFTCAVNIEMLLSQLKAQVDDSVTIEYGKPNTIKIVGDGVVQVIALDA